MKKPSVLNLLLSTTIICLVFYIRTTADSNPEPLPQPEPQSQCNFSKSTGFSPANSISRSETGALAENYGNFAAGRNDNITGGIISKAALDSLFCTGNFNALSYRLMMDPSGRTGPANSVFIVIAGVNVAYANNGQVTITSQSASSYRPNLWCPPTCGSVD